MTPTIQYPTVIDGDDALSLLDVLEQYLPGIEGLANEARRDPQSLYASRLLRSFVLLTECSRRLLLPLGENANNRHRRRAMLARLDAILADASYRQPDRRQRSH